MKIDSVKLAYFSPTGTSKAVVQGIARGFGPGAAEIFDITRPDGRTRPLRTSASDLLIIAVPVYMGRIPALLGDWLSAIEADDTPTVCVVVYGNRAYENALLELRDAVAAHGCVPVAGAAYIGEHSFATPDAPVALGRPDADDLSHAEAFGRQVRKKLDAVSRISDLPEVHLPGSYPYEGATKIWDVDFIEVSGVLCGQCGICAEVCPVGAVDPEDSAVIDKVKCITCCACIKACPENARTIKPGPVADAQKRLSTLFAEPKSPECFL